MSTIAGALALLLHLGLMLAAAPFVTGLIQSAKARLVGRKGPSVLQPWRDLARLLRKQPVVADSTSAVFAAAPLVCLSAMIAATALVPSFALGLSTAPLADLLVIAGLMGLARAALALAAMDTGTGLAAIAASREMMFASLAEPAFFLVIFTLALLAGSTNLDIVAALVQSGTLGLRISMALALVATLIVAAVQCGRMPVDNPAGHTELAMVHGAMVLDYSGRHLAMLEFADALKLLVWMTLIATVFAPFGMAPHEDGGASLAPWLWAAGLLAWAIKIGIMTGLLAVHETSRARLRMFRVPELLGMALLLGLLAAIFLFVSQGFA